MTPNSFYVYMLIDPRTNKPFYVGKGKGNRAKSHLLEARGGKEKWSNKIKCQIINSIERANREVQIFKVEENLSEDQAYQLEAALVERHGRLVDGTGILSNIADGGNGGVGATGTKPVQCYTATGALIATYSSLSAAATELGIHKSAICAALNGRTVFAGGFRWTYHNQPLLYVDVTNTSPVTQFTMTGREIKTFDSIKQASTETNTAFTSIVMCCRGYGNCRTAGGFRWAYAGECPHPLPSNYKYQGPDRILQGCDLTGCVVREFRTIKEATKETAANSSGISDCCAGRKKTSGGMRWRWVNPY